MRIAVVGSGYVGLVAGACFADLGHEVILVDNDSQKVAALEAGGVPIHERFLPELLERHRGNRLTFSGNLAAAVRASSAIFIAVGERPTGGFKPRVLSAAVRDGKFVVEYMDGKPSPETFVTQALTRPWVIAIVAKTSLPVVMHAQSAR